MFINKYLINFARGHGALIAGACLLQLLITALGTAVSLCIAFIVRMLQGEKQILFFTQTWQIFLLVAVLLIVRFVLFKTKVVVSEHCSLKIKTSLRVKLLNKLFSLGPAYVGKARTGNIASAISSKVEYLNEYYTIYLPAAISALVNAVILIIVLMYLNKLTALLCIAGCVGMTFCPMLFYFIMRKRGEEEMRMYSQYYSDCLDSLQGMPTLKAFNADKRQKELIYKKGETLRQAIMGQLRITTLENVVLQFFVGLGSAVSVAMAAYQCTLGNMPQGSLVYALFLISACVMPMASLITAWHMGYRGVVASYSIIELMNAKGKLSLSVVNSTSTEELKSFKGDIQFNKVFFSYNEKDGDVLKDISFTIPNGTTTALVGISGSGKSTVAHLLAGFYPVENGEIVVGKNPLNKETVCSIQNQIAAVWQECSLFYGTVEENILLGRPEADHEAVVKAAKLANIHDFIISLPEGYNTSIGERGARFSGGEKQRIALARAFLRDAPIVILDEATSSLDRKNEMAIQQSLHALSRGKTALVIAHRLATIQAADQIILMENGKIVDIGTHNQLLNTSQRYRTLMENQLIGGACRDE
ncbi:MAG: ABC transporter ATP-binding protein [Eubacteriales bacterium]|nr:ABC transporter ATP-binding protein [Eubacteriales bacterium]